MSRALTAAAVGSVLALLPASATRAAESGLLVTVDALYRVVPSEERVHVVLDALATSLEPDTDDGQVYYSGITFLVPAAASNVVATAAGSRLAADVVEEGEDYRVLEVTFSRGVFFRQSYAYRVEFDLVDTGGDGDRDLRIGESVVAFPIWAYGSDGADGSSVRVELPAGYVPSVQGSAMEVTPSASGTVLSARPSDPLDFFAYLSADRPGAFEDTPLEVTLAEKPARITVRAWEDDPDWAARMVDLLSRGLPAMEQALGVPYPHDGRLKVEEAAISRLGVYAGIYDPNGAVIRIRYDADAIVALHEAAHIWFNERLFDDRWINEAWAEYYAVTVADSIGVTGATWQLDDDLRAGRIALNDWREVGREDLAVEDFAYAATYELARAIAERTDAAALQDVWQAADAREPSYLPPDGADPDAARAPLGQPGWQRLLDLLEERSGIGHADLWAEWVVNRHQQLMLAARASARSAYASALDKAGKWQLPASIRASLGDWDFDEAREELRRAERILADRDRIAAAASKLGLQPSDGVRAAFEAEDGLSAAPAVVQAELATLDELAAATRRLESEATPLEAIGLLGAEPTGFLEDARAAYAAGELSDARRAASDALDALRDAGRQGAARVTLAGGLLLVLDGAALSVISARRIRRRPAGLSAS